jgi:hypothetical protein
VMNTVSPSAGMSMWGCIDDRAAVPPWLVRPQQMRWVGALWLRGSDPAQASRPTRLPDEYDGLLYLPRVTAEDIVRDRPSVPLAEPSESEAGAASTSRRHSCLGVPYCRDSTSDRSGLVASRLKHARTLLVRQLIAAGRENAHRRDSS